MEQCGISKLNLKIKNRTQILYTLKKQGPTSRIDLAAALGITRAAITIIVSEMLEQGVLIEQKEMPAENLYTKGRRKIPIDINPNYKFVFGISIDNNSVSASISTLKGDILDKSFLDIQGCGNTQEAAETVFSQYTDLLASNCLSEDHIIGTGIAFGHFKQWDYKSFADEISAKLNTPVVFDNLTTATAMASADFCNLETHIKNRTVFLELGKTYNVVLLDSTNHLAAPIIDIGRFIVNFGGRTFDGYPNGSVMAELTPDAIIKKSLETYSHENTPYLYALSKGNHRDVTLDMIATAAQNGDKGILGVKKTSAELLAVLLNNITCINGVDNIILYNYNLPDIFLCDMKENILHLLEEKYHSRVLFSSSEDIPPYLAGCNIAIHEFFYNTGGYDRQ